MSPHNLTRFIKDKAIELGFSGAGMARAEHLEEESGRLNEWLARGYHASMGWMAENADRRADPRAIFPEAKSVVAVAMNYYSPVSHSGDEATGRISRYAWGDDYHLILTERLERLLESIKGTEPSAVGKVYVDTGPVLEKAWAQRAGIGWEGKHTNVITTGYGSWVFLGEIILNLELEYDLPATDRCGSCTLCIEACPTQAIVEPYVLDSNLCISYLTIEHRGAIAEGLGEKFDRWIYGCDICQDVCPWNEKFAQPTIIEGFHPRPFARAPRLEEVAELSQEDFSETFRKSPVKRAKLAGLVRNATVALQTRRLE